MFIDTHVHLTDKKLFCNVEKIRENYLRSGVGKVITVGYDIASSVAAKKLADEYDEVYYAVGVHPDAVGEVTDDGIAILKQLASGKKCVAIGEIGLDYHYDGYDKTLQRNAFIKQISLANELKLPVIIHSRDACKDTVDVLKECVNNLNGGFLMHCFSESVETAKQLIPLGAYFAFGGAITFKNAKKQDVIKVIPENRLLAETDCPYLTPVPHRGEINEPKNVVYVYEYLAETLNVTVDDLHKRLEKNAANLFKNLK